MENEPKELVAARVALAEAEADLNNPQMLNCFERGIDLLTEVISGEYDEKHKNIAKQIATTHRRKIVERVIAILPDADSYNLDFLGHWRNVMETFTEAGLDDDPQLRSCKDQITTKWGLRLLGTLKPWEIERLKKELLERK
jgi:hypothetical protein